uniref:M28 family peptidase n=1 Tax=uncultured Planktosalinus sp. TaxID=1810935 RepID=UPI0030DD3449
FLILCFLVFLSFRLLMPSEISDLNTPENEFSTERALSHLKVISEKPHYIGSPAHQEVREYLISQLELLGLEAQIQEGYTLNKKWNVLAKPKNILARIPGREKGKALMLLAHYDSAPHSKSYGASDAGSGVVTILEGVRAYLASGQIPKNDLIILFSDAEEIGLMGAKLFVEEHPWVNDVGIVVNFEARGSGGPSNMILETNEGNATLVKEFVKANPSFPVASSLMYSVYKMLPNDTDSTIFRELADIDSYFFAFIDDHYHYHTSADTFENLDRNTLEHQGSYVMAILSHFTESDLSNLKAEEDYIYFNVPFIKLISYPFSWIIPMLMLAILLFVALVLYGIAKGKLLRNEIYKGFVPFLSALILSGLIAYGGWKLMLKIYPGYSEILHGFTYNGHLYIASFVALTLTICFRFYGSFNRKERPVNLFIAPLFLWLIIAVLMALYLKGAAYFIIPVYFGLLMLYLMIRHREPSILLMLFLCIPALFIFAPLIQFFPVGLGLDMLFVSAVFTVLLFGLLVPVLASFKKKKIFSYLFFLLAIGCFLGAHFTSDFNEDRQKPNSLVYFQDVDSQQAFWVTFDQTMDEWTRSYLGNEPLKATDLISNVAESKYGTGFSYAVAAPGKEISEPEVVLLSDSVYNNLRTVKLLITPQRTVNRIALFADKEAVFKNFVVNGQSVPINQSTGNAIDNRPTSTLLNFYVSDNDALEVEYSISIISNHPLIIQEMSFDLLEHQQFAIPKRSKNEMPKPFITNDAVILQKSINPNSLRKIAQPENIADTDETD